MPKKGERVSLRWARCEVCGYEWYSRAKTQTGQEKLKCPKCQERRTGTRPGRSPEFLRKIRLRKGTGGSDKGDSKPGN